MQKLTGYALLCTYSSIVSAHTKPEGIFLEKIQNC